MMNVKSGSKGSVPVETQSVAGVNSEVDYPSLNQLNKKQACRNIENRQTEPYSNHSTARLIE